MEKVMIKQTHTNEKMKENKTVKEQMANLKDNCENIKKKTSDEKREILRAYINLEVKHLKVRKQ